MLALTEELGAATRALRTGCQQDGYLDAARDAGSRGFDVFRFTDSGESVRIPNGVLQLG